MKKSRKNISFFSFMIFTRNTFLFNTICIFVWKSDKREMQNLVSWEKLKTGTYVFMHRFSRDEKTIHHKTIPKTEMCQEQIHWQKLDLRLETGVQQLFLCLTARLKSFHYFRKELQFDYLHQHQSSSSGCLYQVHQSNSGWTSRTQK